MQAADGTSMFVRAGTGETLTFMGMDLVWKIASGMSGGAYAAFLQVGPPGTGVPMQIHHHDNENIFVIDGEVLFNWPTRSIKRSKGTS